MYCASHVYLKKKKPNIYLPQHHAQFFHMDSCLAFQVLSKHLTLKVDFL